MDKPWYKEGVRFKCTECGKCCTGGPGYVWVNEEEIVEMAAFLKIDPQNFREKYVRKTTTGKLSLIEKQHHDCIFLKDKKCQIYGARPTQCKTFPFWPDNLRSQEIWDSLKESCEGVDSEASLVPFETIEKQLLIQIKRNKND